MRKNVIAVLKPNTATVIHRISPACPRSIGAAQHIQPKPAIGIADARIQGRRRPRRCSVLSLQIPAIGSVTPSQSRPAMKIMPMAAGGTSRTSIAYLLM